MVDQIDGSANKRTGPDTEEAACKLVESIVKMPLFKFNLDIYRFVRRRGTGDELIAIAEHHIRSGSLMRSNQFQYHY